MELKLKAQRTPNPFAYKFVTNRQFKSTGKATFNAVSDCVHIPMAVVLLSMDHVTQVHFFDNFLTVTQNGIAPWEELLGTIERVIRDEMNAHDPNFKSSEEVRRESLGPELTKIEEILDETIRPSLQMDGGDVQVLRLQDSQLWLRYEGACGSCPSAMGGTLQAIEGILQERYREDIAIIVEDVMAEKIPGHLPLPSE